MLGPIYSIKQLEMILSMKKKWDNERKIKQKAKHTETARIPFPSLFHFFGGEKRKKHNLFEIIQTQTSGIFNTYNVPIREWRRENCF
jgi:hypothetical protein